MGMPNEGALIALGALRPVLYAEAPRKCKLVVLKEPFIDDPDHVWSDLVEADYKGYARKDIGIGDVGTPAMLDSLPCIPMSLYLFTFDGTAEDGEDDNALYGWAIIQLQPDNDDGDPVEPKLIICRRWPDGVHGEPAITINADSPAFQFAPRIVHRFIAP
jgi:hypothetical protein